MALVSTCMVHQSVLNKYSSHHNSSECISSFSKPLCMLFDMLWMGLGCFIFKFKGREVGLYIICCSDLVCCVQVAGMWLLAPWDLQKVKFDNSIVKSFMHQGGPQPLAFYFILGGIGIRYLFTCSWTPDLYLKTTILNPCHSNCCLGSKGLKDNTPLYTFAKIIFQKIWRAELCVTIYLDIFPGTEKDKSIVCLLWSRCHILSSSFCLLSVRLLVLIMQEIKYCVFFPKCCRPSPTYRNFLKVFTTVVLPNILEYEVCLWIAGALDRKAVCFVLLSFEGSVVVIGCKIGICWGLKVHYGTYRDTLQRRGVWTCQWSGLGSLVVRTVLQPGEDKAFTVFSW